MKLSFRLLTFLFAAITGNSGFAQTPCSGTPGPNTIVPLSQTICAGSQINLSLLNSYTNSGVTFQWQTSNVSIVGPYSTIPGATLHTYAAPSLTTTTFFNVIITCTNSGLSISVPYSVTVIPCNVPCTGTPGVSSILPANATVCIGNSAALSLSSTYTETGIAYQWYTASTSTGPYSAVSGASLSTYVTPTLSTITYYQVVVTCTNSSGSFTTSTQTVTPVPCLYCSGPPASNTILPITATVCAGNSATLGLANTYSASGYTFQWQQSSVSQVGPFQNILGANSTTYTTPNLTNTTYYNIVITCTNGGQNISLSRGVTVINCNVPCSSAPSSNTILPTTTTLCAGNATLLSLAVNYFQTGYAYQWGIANAAAGPYTAIATATQNTYSTPPLVNNVFYNVVITCTNSGMSTTATQSIQVIPCVNCSGPPSSNTIVPINSTICAGSAVTLSLANTYSNAGYSYQWQQSSVSAVGPFSSISGATTSIYAISSLTVTTYFNVIITCTTTNGSISTSQVVNVVPCSNLCTGAPATTSILPLSQTLCVGGSAQLSLSTTYTTSGLLFQWGASNNVAGPYTAIPGATLMNYTTPNLSINSFYNVVITCTNSGQSTSATRSISVINCNNCNGIPISNIILPINSTICAGAPLTLSLVNSYTIGGITYQWQSSTVGVSGPYVPIVGATNSVLAIPNLTLTTYFKIIITCTLSNLSQTVTQVVYVQPCVNTCSGAPASNTVLPSTQTICPGSTASMSLAATYTSAGITYRWESANTAAGPFNAVPGATINSYVTPTLNATTFYNAVITCSISGLSSRATSTVFVLICGNTVGIQKNTEGRNRVSLIPNPSKGLFTVESSINPIKQILLVDMTGRVLFNSLTIGQAIKMDVQDLQSGVYTVFVDTGVERVAIKMIKE